MQHWPAVYPSEFEIPRFVAAWYSDAERSRPTPIARSCLRQAQLADGSQIAPSRNREITDDWSRVPLDELERDRIAHLDALGFRYYIPALMLSVLDHYDPASMRVTLSGLYPKKDGSWEYHMKRYSLLNDAQKSAVAHFLTHLPELVELGLADQKLVARALRNYWGKYLQTNAGGKR